MFFAIGPPAAAKGSSNSPQKLTGAGSTFDQPFFTSAFYYYKRVANVTVTYASIGSGGGQQQIESNLVNFGATDVPMLAADLAKASGTIVQVPVTLGGEAISYNLYGVKGGLKMTGPVLAQIYLGKITNWDNSAIKALNPGVALPNEPITVVHRSDGSGTTYAFTDYLSKVSSTWLSQVGRGKTVAWPVGVGGQGNEGVAGTVADTPGSIGYVELDYALVNHFTYCKMMNANGYYVSPTLQTTAAEASLLPNVSPSNFSITNLKAPKNSKLAKMTYPIATYSWVAVYKKQKSATTGKTLVDALRWLTTSGQKYAKELQYVPLPPAIETLARNQLAQVVGPNGQAFLTASKSSTSSS